MKCPCQECICVPVCRYKKYEDLFDDCCLAYNYMSEVQSNHLVFVMRDPKLRSIYEALNAVYWEYVYNNKYSWENKALNNNKPMVITPDHLYIQNNNKPMVYTKED